MTLTAINVDLKNNLESIRAELHSLEHDRNRLSVKISELLLKQSDMVQYNTNIMDKIRSSQEENIILREQIKSLSLMKGAH